MALAIDASTPAIKENTNNSVSTVTTASFTPPSGALLLIRWAGNSAAGVNPSTPSITDNLGVHLTYTLLDWQSRADSPTVNGQAACWWAVVGSSAAMTVTVTTGSAAGSQVAAMHVTVITGQHSTPIGAHGKSGSASAASIAQNYTATATSGQGFIGVCDWDDKGAETAGTGCTLTNGGSASITGQISYGFVRRTSADDVNGNSNTLNVTIPTTSTNLAWVYAEVVPAASTTILDPRTVVVPEVSQPPLSRPVVAPPTIGPPQAIPIPRILVVPEDSQGPGPFPILLRPPFLSAQVPQAPPIVVAAQSPPPLFRTPYVSPAQFAAAAPGILPLTVTVVAEQFRPSVVAPIVLTPPPLPQAPAPITVVPAQAQRPLAAVIAIVPSPLPQAVAPIVVVTSTWRPQQPQISVSQPGFAAPIVPVLAVVPTLVAPTFRFRPGPGPLVLTPAPLPVGQVGIALDGRIITSAASSQTVSTDAPGRTTSSAASSRTISTDAQGRIVSTIEGGRL